MHDAFGPPSDISLDRAILKYGGLEVTLREGLVEVLHIELDQPLPSFLDADGLTPDTTLDALGRLLDERSVSFEPHPELTFDQDQTAIRSGSGVVMIFPDGRLFAISASGT